MIIRLFKDPNVDRKTYKLTHQPRTLTFCRRTSPNTRIARNTEVAGKMLIDSPSFLKFCARARALNPRNYGSIIKAYYKMITKKRKGARQCVRDIKLQSVYEDEEYREEKKY